MDTPYGRVCKNNDGVRTMEPLYKRETFLPFCSCSMWEHHHGEQTYRTEITLSWLEIQYYGKAVREREGEFVQLAQRRKGDEDGRVKRKEKGERRNVKLLFLPSPFSFQDAESPKL